MILPAYTDMGKQSVVYINKFGCPPEYLADTLRDVADALTTVHPNSAGDCSCCQSKNPKLDEYTTWFQWKYEDKDPSQSDKISISTILKYNSKE